MHIKLFFFWQYVIERLTQIWMHIKHFFFLAICHWEINPNMDAHQTFFFFWQYVIERLTQIWMHIKHFFFWQYVIERLTQIWMHIKHWSRELTLDLNTSQSMICHDLKRYKKWVKVGCLASCRERNHAHGDPKHAWICLAGKMRSEGEKQAIGEIELTSSRSWIMVDVKTTYALTHT